MIITFFLSVLHAGSSYGLSPATPYTYTPLASLQNSYTAQHHSLQTSSQRIHSGGSSSIYTDASVVQPNTSSVNGLYSHSRSSFSQPPMMAIGMHHFSNWASTTPFLPTTSMSLQNLQSRQAASGNAAPLHSPITAQVYSADLRTHSVQSLEAGVGSDGTYTLHQQHSPDQMLPECASTEPSRFGYSINYL